MHDDAGERADVAPGLRDSRGEKAQGGRIDFGGAGSRFCFADKAAFGWDGSRAPGLACLAGVVRMVRDAERKWCCRRPAVYSLAPEYAGRVKELVIEMPSCFVKKRGLAPERRAEKRRRLLSIFGAA